MKWHLGLVMITTLILASTVWADGPTIVETDSVYIVEYTGTPNKSDRLSRAEYLVAEIDRLTAKGDIKAAEVHLKELRELRDASRQSVEDLKRKFAENNERFRQKYEPKK